MSRLDKRTFEKFRRLVYDKSGISLGEQKEALVAARIGKRMRTLNMESFDAYLKFVTRDESGEEVVHLIDAISTNVTGFFREPEHFDFLAKVLAKWRDSGQTRFRIWSAAGSTGEEPFTLAMVMLETLGSRASNVRILATDISTQVLERCRVGAYKKERLAAVPSAMRDRYFVRAGNRHSPHYVAKEELRRILLFKRLNLSTPPFPMRGPLDCVFCRNVMIYFDNEVRGKLLAEIYRLLKPGGYLMVGHAESLTGMVSDFKTVRPSIYTK